MAKSCRRILMLEEPEDKLKNMQNLSLLKCAFDLIFDDFLQMVQGICEYDRGKNKNQIVVSFQEKVNKATLIQK